MKPVPATPVEVLGLQGVPKAGEAFQVVAGRFARAADFASPPVRRAAAHADQIDEARYRSAGRDGSQRTARHHKADVQGSVEVLKSTLEKMSTERVKVKVIRSGVGAITESDVLLASATQAGSASSAVVIIGFNVRPESRAAELSKQESVDIRLHSIIYKVEEEIKAAMIGMLDKIEKEKILGKADVREVFRVPKIGSVAGCMVIDGIITRKARARLIRDGVVAWEGNIGSAAPLQGRRCRSPRRLRVRHRSGKLQRHQSSDQIEAYIIERVAATEL
jgi:translation initiation factor IF-2